MRVGNYDIMSFYEEDLIDLRMSINVFLNNDELLEATADELAMRSDPNDKNKYDFVPYQKLFNIDDKIVLGFAGDDIGPQNTLDYFRLSALTAVRKTADTDSYKTY